MTTASFAAIGEVARAYEMLCCTLPAQGLSSVVNVTFVWNEPLWHGIPKQYAIFVQNDVASRHVSPGGFSSILSSFLVSICASVAFQVAQFGVSTEPAMVGLRGGNEEF